ncbi:alpha/beta hydrolase [Chryseobacterium sp. PMSZPI]|uniref:alpha/beta hydrolase n=1 Tax=Chryseobacterium sp. PMSZPI TaxID=1033900 RepID=UPI001E65514D|nr:alpha/beta hydrolase [Chryseobacterium sp. PMSZPI]
MTFFFVFICLLLTSCKEKKINLGQNANFTLEENISYGIHPEQVMDLYIPQKNPNGKKEVFMIIHGGGWRAGNKSQLTFFTLSLMKKFPSHIFVNINYRLASETNYALPDQMYDIKDVSAFLEKKLHYSPKFILLGNSAGGHLSMLYAYQFDPLKNVKAVINIVGPADLTDASFKRYQDYSFVERKLVNPQAPKSGISRIHFGNPVQWIKKSSPPTLSYYGKTDRVIPSTQAKILDSALTQNNVIHETYTFNGGHLDWDKEPNNIFLIDKVETFLKRVDKK